MSAPGLKVHPDVAVPWKIYIAHVLSKYVPKLPIPPKMPTDRLYNVAVHDRNTDPLNNLIGTRVGFAVECVETRCSVARACLCLLVYGAATELDAVSPPRTLRYLKAVTEIDDDIMRKVMLCNWNSSG